jgi:WD40 repeat protein
MQLSHLKSSKVFKAGSILGGTCLSFTRDQKAICLIGTESGNVLKCDTSLAQVMSTKMKPGDPLTGNIVSFTFFPAHTGPVQSIAASPFDRNVFLSCGSDGQLRMYNVLESKPQTILEPSAKSLYACDWSKSNENVFACCSADGYAYIFNTKVKDLTNFIR